MTTPAILYAAKSTMDKHDSIPDQLRDCRAMAADKGWEVVGEFQDEAKSGYSGNRGSGLAQAQQLAAANKGILVVQHSSRFARGDAIQAQHLVEVFLWAQRAGVTLRSVEDDAMVQSLLTAVVAGDQNHAESKRKGESVSN
jgi:DNA invertase Pin-like site-specific DNA recombinase